MRTAILISAVIFSACAPQQNPGNSGSAVSLGVAPAEVAPGDSVTLTLSNASTDTVGYNLCTSGLERLNEGTAEVVPSDRICTMELRMLQPGDEADYVVATPATLEAGNYRYRTGIEMIGTGMRSDVTSPGFQVIR